MKIKDLPKVDRPREKLIAKEKLEIVIGAAEPRLWAGLPRRRRLRNMFELS